MVGMGCNMELDVGKSQEEDVVVVGNNAEDTGIQTVDSPVDAQIGSWVVVDGCQRRHDKILVDASAAGGADPMVDQQNQRQKFPGWVAVGQNYMVTLVLATE